MAAVYNGLAKLEMDCKSVVEHLKTTSQIRSSCYGVIQDIKEVFSSFATHKISFAGRGCNRLAHELAAKARQLGDMLIITGVPDSLRSLMLSECNPPLE